MIQLGYQARVAVPIEDQPDRGGGPIRRGNAQTIPSYWANEVYRSGNDWIPDAQPGADYWDAWWQNKKFLPDGRVRDRAELGQIREDFKRGFGWGLGAALAAGTAGGVVALAYYLAGKERK